MSPGSVRLLARGLPALTAADDEIGLVILDLSLPTWTGFDACPAASVVATLRLPVLMLTARRDELDVVVGLDSGADDYVTKPFRLGRGLFGHFHRRSRGCVAASRVAT